MNKLIIILLIVALVLVFILPLWEIEEKSSNNITSSVLTQTNNVIYQPNN